MFFRTVGAPRCTPSLHDYARIGLLSLRLGVRFPPGAPLTVIPHNMSPLTLFGLLAVSSMLVFYALEERSRSFVLLFAAACASSLYGFLQGAWPFGVVEAIWTGVAVRRWHQRPVLQPNPEPRPIACDMSALSREERQRYDLLRARVVAAIDSVTPTAQSFQLRLGSAVTPIPPRGLDRVLLISRRLDSNQRPSGPEPDALPG
jgi:hypothetical protein